MGAVELKAVAAVVVAAAAAAVVESVVEVSLPQEEAIPDGVSTFVIVI